MAPRHATRRRQRTRFTPGVFYYCVVFGLCALSWVFLREPSEIVGLRHILVSIFCPVAALYLILSWQMVLVEAKGLRLRTPLSGSFYAWDKLGEVRGYSVKKGGPRGGTMYRTLVTDTYGDVLIAVSPWVARQAELTRLVRDRLRAAHG